MDAKLKIACAANKKFAVLLCVLLKSLEINHCSKYNTIDVFIIDNNIGRKRKLKIVNSIDSSKINITFLKVSSCLKNTLDVFPNGSKFTHYYRLFLPNILPQNINRVLYLDCDMLVLKDLYGLWNTTLKQNEIIGAVQDCWLKTVDFDYSKEKQVISNWKELGFNKGDAYFNSGVLLIDLAKWRKYNVTKNVIDTIANNYRYTLYPYDDQYGLNVTLKDKWRKLNTCFNTSSTKVNIVINNVHILHFTGNKPISFDYPHNYQDLFYQYLDQTKWSNQRGKKFIKIPNRLEQVLTKNKIIFNSTNRILYKLNHYMNSW
ncbi:glycosyltransferase [Flavobacteriaceae bacterium]|nr:glycosyltransferase [Flavobacteriaceae bacterium]